jgi:signal transduction histidine kinase/CheY-like chemotaxis protein
MDDLGSIRRALANIDDPSALLAGVFANAPIAMQVYAADGHCLVVNRAFRALFGSEPPAGYNVLTDRAAEKLGVIERIRRALAGETVALGPTWFDPSEPQAGVEKGNRVAIETVMFPLYDSAGAVTHVALTFKDVTADLKLRADHDHLEKIHRMEQQLRQTQKLEAVGKLAGGIAHDFNNLLSVIITYTGLALESPALEASVRSDLEETKRAADRAAVLTGQLLAFSRQQVLQPKVVDLNWIVRGMETMVRRLIGEDVELALLTGSSVGSIFADPSQIEHLMMNLVINARDAMPGGGKLTIKTANAVLDADFCAAHIGANPGPHVKLAVTDSGVGMDASTRARVFEPFFTTKELGKGTGLGLATVFGIVQQSGGTIWVDSEPERGTTFEIYFPRVSTGRASTTPAPASGELTGTETILLVEDEEQVRVLARTVLLRRGYNVLEAQNGGEAFLVCEQFEGEIHLLLTDVVMPKMSGRQLAERLVTLRPNLKVLYMSGYTEDSIIHHGVLEEGIAFLQKPITPNALARKVRDVLGGGD